MFTRRLIVGDWSGDGHNHRDFVLFEASHDRKQIIEAYKQSAIKADISVCKFKGGPADVLCADYGDNLISSEALKKLTALEITKQDLVDTSHFEDNYLDEGDGALITWGEGLAHLFLMMVSKSLPDFTYKLLKDDTHDCINGFWQRDFNGSIGYGVFSD